MTAPKLTKAQREALEMVVESTDPYTYEAGIGFHSTLMSMVGREHGVQRDGLVTFSKRGHAYYWQLTDAGRAALKDGAK